MDSGRRKTHGRGHAAVGAGTVGKLRRQGRRTGRGGLSAWSSLTPGAARVRVSERPGRPQSNGEQGRGQGPGDAQGRHCGGGRMALGQKANGENREQSPTCVRFSNR